MNAQEAADQALALAEKHQVRIRKTRAGYVVETIHNPSPKQESKELTRSIEKRLRRMENLLEKAATPRPDKLQSLARIAGVVDGYLQKLQAQRGHDDIGTAIEMERTFQELQDVKNMLEEIITAEKAGKPKDDDTLQVDLYHRVSEISKELAKRLRESRGIKHG